MSTISAILESDADGILHLPVPPELRHRKLKVEAQLQVISGEISSSAEGDRQQRLSAIMQRICERDPFKEIADPVAWQRAIREDVDRPNLD